ncbi:YaaC family protein [Kroppenstedtia eburnea]|nr:YaaC family protein [Kroppenstedtia eburnea]QKI80540.1 hypothetical protein GXN75_00040 [Kroppenstedtia eburnea]
MDSPVRRILCDSPEQKMWNLFLLLENESTLRTFLESKYRKQGMEHPSRAAFRAAQPLMYHVKQAREYYRAARESDLFVRPLLAYYGMITLSKVLMLTMVPDYPENAAVLRHGISTRRRKRGDYQFFADEVRVQREGLFPELARNRGWGVLVGESWTPRELFSLIPELQDGYRQLFSEETLVPVAVPDVPAVPGQGMPLVLEERILDALHLTPRGLVNRLNRFSPGGEVRFTCEELPVSVPGILLFWHHPRISHVNQWERGFAHPLFREDMHGNHWLLPFQRVETCIPELLVHYALLFALSMLCRYEPPLWGEMIHGMASEEMVLIQEFLQVTQRKFPNLILNELFEEKILFRRM